MSEVATKIVSDEQIISLVSGLCKLVLTNKDCFDEKEVETYIESISKNHKETIANLSSCDENRINGILFVIITRYLNEFVSNKVSDNLIGHPFVFTEAGNYGEFKKCFEANYKKIIEDTTLPFVFNCTFDYIKNISEHFTIFQRFYAIRSQETSNEILSNARTEAVNVAKKQAQKAVKSAIDEVDNHTKLAEEQAKDARVQAEIAKEQAKEAQNNAQKASKDAVESAVSNKMAEITSHISENSVTILGIFAGIVLTVVAGLFYSSSVLESVNSANFCRLISVASLVGLVCYHLIALMFRSIDKIKGNDTALSKLSCLDKNISWILIGLFILCSILQFVFPEKNDNKNVSQTATTIYANVDVNTNETSDSSQQNKTENLTTELTTEIATNSNTTSKTTTKTN